MKCHDYDIFCKKIPQVIDVNRMYFSLFTIFAYLGELGLILYNNNTMIIKSFIRQIRFFPNYNSYNIVTLCVQIQFRRII